MGYVVYRWKDVFKTFVAVYHNSKSLIAKNKTKNQFCNCFSNCKAGWSKEPQWENDYGSYFA